jgi:hypothetical protein
MSGPRAQVVFCTTRVSTAHVTAPVALPASCCQLVSLSRHAYPVPWVTDRDPVSLLGRECRVAAHELYEQLSLGATDGSPGMGIGIDCD